LKKIQIEIELGVAWYILWPRKKIVESLKNNIRREKKMLEIFL